MGLYDLRFRAIHKVDICNVNRAAAAILFIVLTSQFQRGAGLLDSLKMSKEMQMFC